MSQIVRPLHLKLHGMADSYAELVSQGVHGAISTMVEDLMTVRIKETLKKIDGSTNFYCNEKQLENLCESYHKSKCVDIKPVGRVIWRNGESFVDWVTGYFPEAGTKIFTTPQPSDAEAKMKEGVPPKDGRTYLGYFPSREGYFASQCFIPICWSEWGGGTWDNVISGHHIPKNPTHWTDLPLSPNQALERIGES